MHAGRMAALGAAMLVGFGGAALAQSQPTPRSPEGSAVESERGRREGQARRPGPRGRRVMRALFRGIELSEAQRTEVRTVAERFRAERRELRPARPAAGGRRVKPDSARVAAMRQLIDRERAALRAILTSEQQPTFDRNVASLRERMEKARARHADRRRERGPGAE